MTELDAVRAQVVAEHGLPPGAVRFLHGGSVAEVEEQAARLAGLLDSAASQEQESDAPVDLLATARAAKEERRRTLRAALSGREEQPRDASGRYAPRASFDGGARSPLPLPRDPVHDHDQTVGELARLRRVYGDF